MPLHREDWTLGLAVAPRAGKKGISQECVFPIPGIAIERWNDFIQIQKHCEAEEQEHFTGTVKAWLIHSFYQLPNSTSLFSV
jgi:hypothetical protein